MAPRVLEAENPSRAHRPKSGIQETPLHEAEPTRLRQRLVKGGRAIPSPGQSGWLAEQFPNGLPKPPERKPCVVLPNDKETTWAQEAPAFPKSLFVAVIRESVQYAKGQHDIVSGGRKR